MSQLPDSDPAATGTDAADCADTVVPPGRTAGGDEGTNQSCGYVLSDRFDGSDSAAHLTVVATQDTTRVDWLVCPSGFNTSGADPATTITQNELATCSGPGAEIGSDNTPRQPGQGSVLTQPDEAYDVFWDIPSNLDGLLRDILVLACVGDGRIVAGTGQNCRYSIEEDILLDDSSAGGAANVQTATGEWTGICTTDQSGPQSGATHAADPCEFAKATTDAERAETAALFQAFEHGSPVPNNGFVLRATTVPEITSLAGLVWAPTGANDDPDQGFTAGSNNCTLIQTLATHKVWECIIDGGIPDNQGASIHLDQFGGGAGECNPGVTRECILDMHWVVTQDRAATTAAKSFDPDAAGSPNPPDISSNAGCEAGETPDREHSTTNLADDFDEEGCLTDQFNAVFNGAYTVESTGVGALACEGGATAHDHNDDGLTDHCHGTTGADGVARWELDNPNADVGDQDVTFCFEGEPQTGTTPPANHGCADETVKDDNVMHWATRASEVFLAYSNPAPGDAGDPCRTGSTFKENRIGDRETLVACTFDSQGNPINTQPAGAQGGRLSWVIETTVGGELTSVRFTSEPPSETDANGQATAEIEAFREGSNFVIVRLHDPLTGDIIDTFSIEKRVRGGGGGGGGTGVCAGKSTGDPTPGGGQFFIGTNGDDAFSGTPGDDIFCLLAGDDVASGGGGDDLMLGQGGNDTMKGDGGKDNMRGGGGRDSIDGKAKNDVIRGGGDNDSLRGNNGFDTIRGGGGNDTLQGGKGNDILRGGGGNDTLKGFTGDDLLNGGRGTDTCRPGKGNDQVKNCEN